MTRFNRIARAIVGMTFGFALASCTTMNVQPIEASVGLKRVCIQKNDKVLVTDFLPVVQEGFRRHGIETAVFSGMTPEGCEFILGYTALRSWDLTPYLSHAELHLLHGGREIASAEFHLVGGGGYALTKYNGTKKKMDPVIDELLSAY